MPLYIFFNEGLERRFQSPFHVTRGIHVTQGNPFPHDIMSMVTLFLQILLKRYIIINVLIYVQIPLPL